MTTQQAIKEIIAYISNNGGIYSEWYIGIATYPEDRLFNDHKVERMGFWIYCPCDNSSNARAVEGYFIEKGSKGGGGGGDYSTKTVYAYKITPHTVETA